MLGDVLLIQDKHRRAAASLLRYVLESSVAEGRFVVAISGESGSGKSELAHLLARLLVAQGIVAKPISVDDFYSIPPGQRAQWRERMGIERVVGPGEYDMKAIQQCLHDFRGGRQSTMPCVDLVTGQVDRLSTDFSRVDALILDGLYALAIDDVDIPVFIDLTYRDTRRAQRLRGKEPMNQHRGRVLRQEHRVLCSLKPLARLLVTREYLVEEQHQPA